MMHHVLFVMNRINTMNTEQKNNELVKYSDQAWTRLVNKTSVDEQADFVFVQNTEKNHTTDSNQFWYPTLETLNKKTLSSTGKWVVFRFFYSFFFASKFDER